MLPTATVAFARPEPGIAVLTVNGSMDPYSAPDIRSVLIDMLNEGRYRQVVDLRGVALLDSTGLGVLVGALKRARARGGDLVLVVDLDSAPGSALRITGVFKAIRCVATPDEALELLKPEPETPRPVAPPPSVVAQQILQAQIRDIAREVWRDTIEARLDALADSGQIRGLDEDARLALAGAVERELRAAADEDRITVTISEPTP